MIICLACCQTILALESGSKEKKVDKEPYQALETPCCRAAICDQCVENNPRLAEYCPKCQVRYTDDPNKTPFSPDPPPYDSSPPAYSFFSHAPPPQLSKEAGCIHYLRATDTISGLSLMYRIPIQEIRRANNLFGHDNLIHARHYVTIPGYHGSSLSRDPVETEEEEIRKVALKRFQLLSKCVNYKMATIYMESSRWDIEMALEKYKDDLEWEKAHPKKAGKQIMKTLRRT